MNGSTREPRFDHALVIGGSMAGLVAARILSDHFERVTILERDALSDTPTPRKGVPQGRHLHGLLRRGEDILDALFPGLIPALRAGGAVPCEFGVDVRWHHFGGWKATCAEGVRSIFLTRPFLEAEVRRRVSALAGVRLLDGCEVLGLETDAQRRRVTGALVRRAEGTSPLAADLVVDASGRGSGVPRWLEAIGRPRPAESTVQVRVGYASRIWRRPPDGTHPWRALYVIGGPAERHRLGAVMPIEGGRWISVVAGMLGDYPPGDEAGMMDFARSLPVPDLADALRGAEPLEDIATCRFPAHLRRHYERMRDFPDRLAVLGDSTCSFNPIYGQGITTASLGALTLGECLTAQRRRGGLDGLSRRFQRALARVTDEPWQASTGEDLRWPEVTGTRPLGHGVQSWYTERVHRAAQRDPAVAAAFYRVMHLLAPVSSLLRPAMVLRVLRAATHVESPAPAPAPLVKGEDCA